MPAAYEAPSLRRLRDTADFLWPNRDRRSDGWIGDADHQTRTSDHNKDPKTGVVRARDLDTDGINKYRVLAALMTRAGMRYVIHDGRIYRAADQWRPRRYEGSNPHPGHVHGSLEHTVAAENNAAPYALLGSVGWPTLRRGAKGQDVKELQALLNAHGAAIKVDGIFGGNTDKAVRSFQAKKKIAVDGIVGRDTKGKLMG